MWGGPADVVMGKGGKNNWQDTILLRGKDISGMEVSRINLTTLRKKNAQEGVAKKSYNIWRKENE